MENPSTHDLLGYPPICNPYQTQGITQYLLLYVYSLKVLLIRKHAQISESVPNKE